MNQRHLATSSGGVQCLCHGTSEAVLESAALEKKKKLIRAVCSHMFQPRMIY